MYNVLSSCDFPAYSASGVRGLMNQFQLFCMCLAGLMIVNLKLPILADDPLPKEITNAVGIKLILIPNGKFIRLQRSTGEDWDGDERKHQVTITQDFYLGATEVTQVQYQTVMGSNPSFYQGDEVEGDSSQHPVETVSWHDAVEFCKRLSELPGEKQAGRVYRLPTEAEWEYACRAGTEFSENFGFECSEFGEYAWHQENALGRTHPVGKKKPNPWGLHDMFGNVREWCLDWHGLYPNQAVKDPMGPANGTSRVYRGGSFNCEVFDCDPAIRLGYFPTLKNDTVGFRVAISPATAASKTPE